MVIILLANLSFLFTPKKFPDEAIQKWGDFYIRLNNSMGIRVNGDAFAFVALAIEPHHLFDKNQVRQSRPGYILTAHITGTLIYALTYPFRDQLESFFQSKINEQHPQKGKEKIAKWFSYYAAYILLNFIVLLLTLYLFDTLLQQISGPWQSVAIRNLLLFLLIDNPIMKLFFWSPHVQLFTLLTPLLMVASGLMVARHAARPARLYGYSLLAGILLLFYGSFLLLLPALLTGYWIYTRQNQKQLLGVDFLRIGLMVLFYTLPLACWILIVKYNATQFYSAEVGEFRQFIWIADRLKESTGSFFHALANNSLAFAQTWPSLILSLIILLMSVFAAKKAYSTPKLTAPSRFILGSSLLILICFLWLMGYYADRLTLGISSLLLLISAAYLNTQLPGRIFTAALYGLALAWHIALVYGNPTAIGPYYFN